MKIQPAALSAAVALVLAATHAASSSVRVNRVETRTEVQGMPGVFSDGLAVDPQRLDILGGEIVLELENTTDAPVQGEEYFIQVFEDLNFDETGSNVDDPPFVAADCGGLSSTVDSLLIQVDEIDPDFGSLGLPGLPDLGPGEVAQYVIPVDAVLKYAAVTGRPDDLIFAGKLIGRDNRISALGGLVDQVPANSGDICLPEPPPGGNVMPTPRVEWPLDFCEADPAYEALVDDRFAVIMTPIVMDLDPTEDNGPEIIFSAVEDTSSDLKPGRLFAFNPQTGPVDGFPETVALGGMTPFLDAAFQLAAADVDDDGLVEIVGRLIDEDRLVVYEYDPARPAGMQLQFNDGYTIAGADPLGLGGNESRDGAPTIAELRIENAGAEIVVGNRVYDFNGDGLASASGFEVSNGRNISCVADLDLDGVAEIIAGNRVYSFDGSSTLAEKYTPPAGVGDGYNAIGNFDDDLFGEIVVVDSSSRIFVLDIPTTGDMADATGALELLSQTDAPFIDPCDIATRRNVRANRGGPPIIADVDDMFPPEIGVAGATRYVMFELVENASPTGDDGPLLVRPRWWRQTTTADDTGSDDDSGTTAATVFDFFNDDLPEVVYSDELQFYVFNGATGQSSIPVDDPNICPNGPIVEEVYVTDTAIIETLVTQGVLTQDEFDNDVLPDLVVATFDTCDNLERAPGLCLTSTTGVTMLAVADVDQDGEAEIVVPADPRGATANGTPFSPCDNTLDPNPGDRMFQTGVIIYESPMDVTWAATRSVWNQHAYHITHIAEDGTVLNDVSLLSNWLFPPADLTTPPLEPYNNYRQNVPPEILEPALPDFTAGNIIVRTVDSGSPNVLSLEVFARFGNRGGVSLPEDVFVQLFTLPELENCADHANDDYALREPIGDPIPLAVLAEGHYDLDLDLQNLLEREVDPAGNVELVTCPCILAVVNRFDLFEDDPTDPTFSAPADPPFVMDNEIDECDELKINNVHVFKPCQFELRGFPRCERFVTEFDYTNQNPLNDDYAMEVFVTNNTRTTFEPGILAGVDMQSNDGVIDCDDPLDQALIDQFGQVVEVVEPLLRIDTSGFTAVTIESVTIIDPLDINPPAEAASGPVAGTFRFFPDQPLPVPPNNVRRWGLLGDGVTPETIVFRVNFNNPLYEKIPGSVFTIDPTDDAVPPIGGLPSLDWPACQQFVYNPNPVVADDMNDINGLGDVEYELQSPNLLAPVQIIADAQEAQYFDDLFNEDTGAIEWIPTIEQARADIVGGMVADGDRNVGFTVIARDSGGNALTQTWNTHVLPPLPVRPCVFVSTPETFFISGGELFSYTPEVICPEGGAPDSFSLADPASTSLPPRPTDLTPPDLDIPGEFNTTTGALNWTPIEFDPGAVDINDPNSAPDEGRIAFGLTTTANAAYRVPPENPTDPPANVIGDLAFPEMFAGGSDAARIAVARVDTIGRQYFPLIRDGGGVDPNARSGDAGSSVPPCPGDINNDGRTDLDDFSALAIRFGSTGPDLGGADLTGDNTVDLDDFSVLAVHFGCGPATR